LQHFVGTHSHRCVVTLQVPFGIDAGWQGSQDKFSPVQLSARMPHCQPVGRFAQVSGVQHAPAVQSSPPGHGQAPLQAGAAGHAHMPPTQVSPVVQLHVMVLPQLSVTDGHALPHAPPAA
jgi:hypothetical protein